MNPQYDYIIFTCILSIKKNELRKKKPFFVFFFVLSNLVELILSSLFINQSRSSSLLLITLETIRII